MSLAKQHRERVLAGLIAGAGGAALATAIAPEHDGPRAVAYELMLLQLRQHRSQLKAIQSIERKVAAKRDFLPVYEAWVEGVLESGVGVQDEVLTTIMLWRIDVGDYEAALPLAEYALRWKLAMPERFERSVGAVLAEEVATSAIRQLETGQEGPLDVLVKVADLTAGQDMHDEVRAKLEKAQGLELARRAGDDAAVAAAGLPNAARAYREQALAHLRRAFELHDRCGVKQEIQRLEKTLQKDSAGDKPASNGGAPA